MLISVTRKQKNDRSLIESIFYKLPERDVDTQGRTKSRARDINRRCMIYLADYMYIIMSIQTKHARWMQLSGLIATSNALVWRGCAKK